MISNEVVGSGKYTYKPEYDWAKLPDGWSMPAAAVFGDSNDNVYCFNRDPDHRINLSNFISSCWLYFHDTDFGIE